MSGPVISAEALAVLGGARVQVTIEIGDRAAALLERLVRALEGRDRDETQRPASGEAGAMPAPPAGSAAEQGAGGATAGQQPPPASPPPPVAPARRRIRPGLQGWQDWRTPEREAVAKALWAEGEVSVLTIRNRLAAMDGPPVPAERANVLHWARRDGWPPRPVRIIVRGRGPSEGAKQPAAYSPSGRRRRSDTGTVKAKWISEARAEVMRRVWPAPTWKALRVALAEVPGEPLPTMNAFTKAATAWAALLGLPARGTVPPVAVPSPAVPVAAAPQAAPAPIAVAAAVPVRPVVFAPLAPRRDWQTEARRAVLAQGVPARRSMSVMVAEMRRLPGAELPERMAEVWRWAEELGLRQAAADAADEDDDEGDDAPPPPPPRIERKCLCCGVRFDAPGPYVRMCNGCKKSTAASGMEA